MTAATCSLCRGFILQPQSRLRLYPRAIFERSNCFNFYQNVIPNIDLLEKLPPSHSGLNRSYPATSTTILVTEKFRPVDTCLRGSQTHSSWNLTANIAFRNQFLACTCAFRTDPITDKKEQSKMSRTL